MFRMWVLPFLALIPLAPPPQPSASPDVTSGLKEIGHVRASACQPLLTEGDASIDAALQGNTTVLQTIRTLHGTHLNSNGPDRETSIEEIDDLSTQIDRGAREGNKHIKALRQVAANTTDPAKRQEILALANSLGNAIGEQSSIAMDLSTFVRQLEGREMPYLNITEGDDFPTAPPGAVRPAYLPDTDAMALDMATDFVSRLHDITNDENTAAAHIDGATSGC